MISMGSGRRGAEAEAEARRGMGGPSEPYLGGVKNENLPVGM